MPNTLADGDRGAPHPPSKLGFSFRLGGGSGQLTLGQRTFFGWLHLDRLELEVPDLRLPVDLAAGPETFQRYRTRARQADLRMEQSDLDRFVAERAPALGELGVEELRILACDGHLSLSARVREAGQVAELTARVYLEASAGRLRFACGRALTYGYLPTPAPLSAHRIMLALVGGADDMRAGELTNPGGTTGRYELERTALGAWNTSVRGLGDVDLDPLAMAMWHILPTAGWRLPDTRDLVIDDVRVEAGVLGLSYRAPGGADGDGERRRSRRSSGSSAPESIFLFDTLERLRDADERLCAGDVDGAMRLYRAHLDSHPDDESLLVDRLLAIGSARPELFDECGDLAARALARWPDFAPGHAALASIAVARGDATGAAARYRTLSQAAAASGEREWAARAALTAARLLRRVAPADAGRLYERVIELLPGHAEASEALVDRYSEDERWTDLVRLLRARAAATADPVRRARDHVQAAQILCAELGDPAAAQEELDAAQLLDPLSPAAVEVLAELQLKTGQPAAAAASLERAAALHQERRDRRGQVRALLRAAAQLDEIGEPARAEALHRAVLELVPGEPAALRGAAAAAARSGDRAEAVRLLRSLLAMSAVSPTDAARDSLELARHILASGDGPDAARAPLERAAATGAPLIAAEAHELLAGWARGDRRSDEAVDQLGRAIEALSRAVKEDSAAPDELRARAAALAMSRAELLGELGQRDAALVDQERAFALSGEDHPLRLQAARALAGVARARGDRDAERYWVGALLAHPELPGERSELLARRAQLAFEAGEDLAGALVDIDSALEESLPAAREAGLLRLRADVLGGLGDQAGRARSLERALAAASQPRERAELSLAAAQALLHSGDAAAALEQARAAAGATDAPAGAPEPPALPELRRSALLALGEAAWRARDWIEIERAYGELVAEPSPDRAERAHRLGMAREALGQVDAAAAAYEIVIAEPTAPGDIRIATWRSLAALYEHTADLGRAALAYESFAGDARADLGDTARADAWYRAGDLYRKSGGRERDAERCLEAALQLVGDHMPSLDGLERLKRDEGEFDRVAVILGRKIAATARQPATQKSLLIRLAALQEDRLGRLDVARESYARALAIDPDFRPALRFAARDARARGDIDEAARATRQLSALLPGDTEAAAQTSEELAAERVMAALDLAELAMRHPDPARFEAALAAVRQALDASPGDTRLAEAQTLLSGAAGSPQDPADIVMAAPEPPPGPDAHAPLLAQARGAIAAGQPEIALAALDGVDRAS
ncbi:MAG TPA: hypothetical protein VNO33_12150, partial [Kofleriaceae bacterium]|nr:hypothetical protein [Kofleriaceae bacterium]